MTTRRGTVRVAMAVAGLAVLAAACRGGDGGEPAARHVKVSTEPDVLVSQDPNPIVARNSPALVVNPVQPTNMVVVDRIDRPDYGAGVHVTNNGGGSWQDVALKRPPGSQGKLFNPSVVYDARGLLYVSFVTLTGPGNDPEALWVARSGDGGLSFEEPHKVTGPDVYQSSIAVDRKSGRLFMVWVQSTPEATACLRCFGTTGLPVVLSRSDDGGRTWSPPAQVSDQSRARVGAPALAVEPDGDPAVLYVDYGADRFDWENLPGAYDGTFSLVLARSNDKGRRFEPGQVVDAEVVPPGRFLIYLPVPPAFAIGRKGDMVAVWADARSGDSDILLRRSTDGGATWTPPLPVNRGTVGDGVPQDLPAVGIAPGGRIDVVYYDRTADPTGPTTDVHLSSSSDGGSSFPETIRLTAQPSNRRIGPEGSPHAKEADFGSRIGIASLAGGAITVWTDTRNGTLDTGKQDVFSAAIPLDDNSSVSVGFRLLAGGGLLLGAAGVTLFVLSRRTARRLPPEEPPDVPVDVSPPASAR